MLNDSHIEDYYLHIDALSWKIRNCGKKLLKPKELEWLQQIKQTTQTLIVLVDKSHSV